MPEDTVTLVAPETRDWPTLGLYATAGEEITLPRDVAASVGWEPEKPSKPTTKGSKPEKES